MKKEYAIGVDIGGTSIKYGLCSADGELIERQTTNTPADAPKEKILELLAQIVQETLKFAKKKKIEVAAVGVGTPGSVDVEKGYLIGGTPNFTHWADAGISDFLQSRFNVPVFADNDANLMSFGEYSFGTGHRERDVICITLGTGIGGGIILNGNLYRGSFYAGSEIGHMSIDYRGRPCKCGGTGCWEQYASATAMIRDYNAENPNNPISDTRELFERFQAGEEAARKVIHQAIDYLGAGLANLINIFNPQMIVIGGGVSEAGDEFIEKITQSAFSRAMQPSRQKVKIRAASLGNKAGILGAAAFALKMRHQSDA